MKKSLDEIKQILGKHRAILRDEYKIRNIAVFGSYVRGEQKKRSDLDLLAEFNGPIGLLDLIGAEQYLSKILKTKVDLIPKNDVRPELKAKILREAVTV
ncbi:MAG: nucleotidyltransferase family protein [Nitrospira sp.]|nr:nucleotidyltransferase family protein [Nitrospira sp.]